MSDDPIRSWIDEAARAQAKEARSRRGADRLPLPPPKPSSTPPDDERLAVYRALFPLRLISDLISFLTFTVLIVIVLPGAMYLLYAYAGLPTPLAVGAVLGAVALFVAARVALYFALLPHRFAKFRRWRRELPFALDGWSQLVDAAHLADSSYWRLECTVALTINEPLADEPRQALDSVLFLLCKEANGNFYALEEPVSGFGGDPRKEWSSDLSTIAGSVNTGVVRDLYLFLSERLAVLARAHGSIAAVKIEVSPRECELAPVSVSSEGTSS
jgi:hypothetical protein